MEQNNSIQSLKTVLLKIKDRSSLRQFVFSVGFYIPNCPGFNHAFVLKWGAGLKMCLAYSEAVEINLPNFSTINDLNKDALLLYCLNHNSLKHYFPDHLSSTSITRQFILQVIHAKDKEKFMELENIVRLFINYKANYNRATITVNSQFMTHLNNFQPLVQPNPNSRIFSLSNIPGLNNTEDLLEGLDKKERRLKRKDMVVSFMREHIYSGNKI